MCWITRTFATIAVAVLAVPAWANYEITPALQKEIDRHVEIVKGWAAKPVVIKAVLSQNQKGPLAGIDNSKWKALRRSDEIVKGLESNEAAKFLKERIHESNELYVRIFLNGAQGEKAAFSEKTISYLHKGSPKFDVPFTTGKAWQGTPELDEPTQTYDVQVSVPVVSEAKPIGVLVVGVNLKKLEKAAGK